MRLPVERTALASLRPLRLAGACVGLTLLAACGHGEARAERAAALPLASRTGPQADYPMVLGQPFTVEGVTYTPADTLNYDAVGYGAVSMGGETGVTIAHRTLPLPSYVEVTSLKTGRTILARVERRGPMTGSNLIELSPAAAAQLMVEGDHAPVRVRRVNPPEPERALLRAGERAPERMDTPMSLVGVLMRKLEPNAPALAAAPSAPVAVTPAAPAPAPAAAKPGKPPKLASKAAKPAEAAPATEKPAAAPKGRFVVQVGAFSNAASAEAVARKLGGSVSPVGKLNRVRISGFASAAEAGGALAKAKAAGYSDARIQRAD